MANVKSVAKTTTKLVASALIPGAAGVIAARESYKNCPTKEKGSAKCVMKALGAGVTAQTLVIGLDSL